MKCGLKNVSRLNIALISFLFLLNHNVSEVFAKDTNKFFKTYANTYLFYTKLDGVVLCTEFEGIDRQYLKNFFNSISSRAEYMRFLVNPSVDLSSRHEFAKGSRVLFLYFGSDKFNRDLESCVDLFPKSARSYKDMIGKTGGKVGQPLPEKYDSLKHLKFPKTVRSSSSSIKLDNAVFATHMIGKMDEEWKTKISKRNESMLRTVFELKPNVSIMLDGSVVLQEEDR